MKSSIRSHFQNHYKSAPDVVVSAPGRVEFIGNHTDYNGGCVVGASIDRRLSVAVAGREDERIRLVSEYLPTPLESAVSSFEQDELPGWTKYPLGVLRALIMHTGTVPDTGFDLAISSDLPSGAGLSSSAALEMSTALALSTLRDLALETSALVRIAHRAETEYVGVPCGILDQTVVGFGRKNHLLLIDASDESHRLVPVPEGTSVWIFQTHRSHSLSSSPYADRRAECEAALGVLSAGRSGSEPLAHYSLEELAVAANGMSETSRMRAEHVISEHQRVRDFSALVSDGSRLGDAGRLLFQSHESSRSLFQNSTPELDFLVDTLDGVPGVVGARLTGGGFGGAVLAWTTESFGDRQKEEVTRAYEIRFRAECPAWKTEISDGVRVEAAG